MSEDKMLAVNQLNKAIDVRNWPTRYRAMIALFPYIGGAASTYLESKKTDELEVLVGRVSRQLDIVMHRVKEIEEYKNYEISISDNLMFSVLQKSTASMEAWKSRLFANVICLLDENDNDELLRRVYIDVVDRLSGFDLIVLCSFSEDPHSPNSFSTEGFENINTLVLEDTRFSELKRISLTNLESINLLEETSGGHTITSFGNSILDLIK